MQFTRDSIGDGDCAVADTYAEETPLAIDDMIDYLKKRGFFPEIPERGLWSMSYNEIEFGLYAPASIRTYFGSCPDLIDTGDSGTISFRFYSNGEERAEYLYRQYRGNKKNMYISGRMDEYRRYRIPKEREQEWQQILMEEHIYQHYDETEHINEAVSFLKAVINRPVIYVGQGRLDLIQAYFNGWCMRERTFWGINYDLEHWIFLRESVSIVSSINGWTLFFETYGIGDLAMKEFRVFMDEVMPSSLLDCQRCDAVSEHLSAIWFPAGHPEGPLPAIMPYLDFQRTPDVIKKEVYPEVIRQIKRIIGKDCKRILVYINSGRLVQQVRFFYDDGGGWQDGISLGSAVDYYKKLVVLHGYVKLTDLGRHCCSITTIDWNEEGLQVQYEEYQMPKNQFRYNLLPKEQHLISSQFSDWLHRNIYTIQTPSNLL